MKTLALAVLGLVHGTLLSAQNAPPPANAAGPVHYAFQVEKQARLDTGNAPVPYPIPLRVTKVEGQVVARFVVDADGMAEMNSFEVVKSDHELFSNAVRKHLPTMKFIPAEIGGRRVRQLVEMPFIFSLPPSPL